MSRIFALVLAGIVIFCSSVPAEEAAPDWVKVTADPGWQARDSSGEMVFKDKMWLLGGWYDSFHAPPRDVWSSADGKAWHCVQKDAPWKYSDLGMTLAFGDAMWFMGGWTNGRLAGHGATNEVWSSTDGAKWQSAGKAGWSPRLAAAVVEFKGRMWMLGGSENYYFGDDKSLKNDVWSSSDGKVWTQETPAAGWSPRAYHQAVVLNDTLYVFGGGNYVPKYHALNDVWSSTDGKTWKQVTDKAGWSPRLWFSSAVYQGRMWVLGGWSHNPSRNWGDVWHSTNGKDWTQLISQVIWTPRHEHSSYVFQDKLWVAGGHAKPLSSEVWSLELPRPAAEEPPPKASSETPPLVIAQPDADKPLPFRAGAALVDLAPSSFPVRVNGWFTERTADSVVDPLTARALALADGRTTLVLCVVDSCMVPRGILDEAKAKASQATGVPVDRMLISATHTHSAPAAMGCLGSRMDPAYAAILPGKIAEAVIAAVKNLQPARAGWTAFDDWDHTHNRRWIRRPDKLLDDPFGQPTVRANMHPGHQSPDVTGPSGPVDPQLSMLAVESTEGKPLALLANYSMHYQGSPLLSSDYFGRFTVHIGELLKAGPGFTGIMSQGTSGDLWSGDYSAPAKSALEYDAYAREIAERVAAAYRKIEWHTAVPLAMVETTLTLNNRIPDEARLRWAEERQQALGDQLPQAQADIYALEAMYLHEGPTTEFKLQALRIGDLGITGIPNEVFCLTGLKLKARSPFHLTMNISLANGAEGYIPPPEQHALGGYTTWPARTAKLEEPAETKITAALTTLLEKASGKPARTPAAGLTDHAKAIMEAKPLAFWRMEQMESGAVPDSMERHPATLEPGVALYLPGHDEKPRTAPLSRAFHFAGGRMHASVPLGDDYSVSFWLWNGMPTDARPVTGYAYSRGRDGDSTAAGEHLGIGGTHLPGAQGRLILFNGNESNQLLTGKSTLALKAWHHVVLVREGTNVRVHLDGRPVPDLEGTLPLTIPPDLKQLCFGGRIDGFVHWEGKLDEIAVFPGALAPTTISQLYQAGR